MAEGVTAQRVAAQQDHIQEQHEGTDTEAEMEPAIRVRGTGAIGCESAPLDEVPEQKDDKNQRQVKEIAMDVLEDQGKRILAPVMFPRLAHGTGRGIGPEGFVVGSAVVIAGKAKTTRRPQDEQGGRKQQPRRPPRGLRPKPGVLLRTEQLW